MGSTLGTLGNPCCSTESELQKKELLITTSPRGRSPQRKHSGYRTPELSPPGVQSWTVMSTGQGTTAIKASPRVRSPQGIDYHSEWTERAVLSTAQPAGTTGVPTLGSQQHAESPRRGVTLTSAHRVPASTSLASDCPTEPLLRQETSRQATCIRVQQVLDRLSQAEAAVLFGTEPNDSCNVQTLGNSSPRIRRLEEMKLAMIDHSRADSAFKHQLGPTVCKTWKTNLDGR